MSITVVNLMTINIATSTSRSPSWFLRCRVLLRTILVCMCA
uniref:Uncharacterized protein n=1 Tax=Arundo donax TaxID=35708 RepID=A0A0A8ZTK3_ARUDO